MAEIDENIATLADLAARNGAIVLSVPSAGLVRHYKTRFLGEEEGGFWVEIVDGAIGLLRELHEKQFPVAVSFASGTRRLSFASKLLRIEDSYRVNAQTTVCAVLVGKPTDLKGAQRRAAYRVKVPQDSDLALRIWVIPEHAYLSDRPPASQELKAEVRDISTGGLGVFLIGTETKPLSLVEEQRLRLELKYLEIDLVLDGRLRTAAKAAAGEKHRAGIVFKKLEGDLEGRQKLAALTRIVGELQRAEVRRVRMRIAS